jgi:hypothetical protein
MKQWKFNGLFLLSALVVYQKLTTIPIKFSFFFTLLLPPMSPIAVVSDVNPPSLTVDQN